LPSSAAVTVAAAATKTSGTTGAGVTPGIEAVAVGLAGIGLARWVGVWRGVRLGLVLGLGLGLDGDGFATGSDVDAGGGLAAASELAAIGGLDAPAELTPMGLEGADGAPVAAETGAELSFAALPCPLVHPARSTSVATQRSAAPRRGVICSG